MTDRQCCHWTGASDEIYKYYVYDLPARFEPGQRGNYIYAKRDDSGRWVPIYIGYGDLGDCIGVRHPQAPCIRAKKASHVHVHLETSSRSASQEESDLLENYTQCWFPKGCRVRPKPSKTLHTTLSEYPSP